ncbi:glycosyl hydrolase [Niabella soli]|uniref:glycosyl hydrolase n=1 Tax=Niabella soli TaxID=446683 RepID=UPI0002499740|nr:glycosyl hydrolase [Niabella soli]
MKRRTFLERGSLLTLGGILYNNIAWALDNNRVQTVAHDSLYELFKTPKPVYRPFVRWWWNGDKVEQPELLRELQLLKEAGIGGVEINPIKFPQRTDDMNIPSLTWLSDGWIDALDFTLTQAKKLDLTCDLIVGSGWPFGAEYLTGDERASVMTIGVKKVIGLMDFEAPLLDFIKEADPATTSPYPRRELEIQKVFMLPDPMKSLDEIVDLSDQIPSGFIKTKVPRGNYAIYALLKTNAFLEVINGAPGANGPVLNHYNKAAVEKYLNHMTDTIQRRIGPLKGRVRALFVDSLELEGANWTPDMAAEFQKRRGYDLMPYLPLILFKTGGMGNVYDYNYGVQFSPEFQDTIERVRCDFDRTKIELLKERFVDSFEELCKKNGLLSRAQAYGRGYHPLEGSMGMDIPEGETWIKYGVGEEMPETDYRIGRGYSMVNKFVSSGAHLAGKRVISCEECTNTDMVFNASLETLKLASDQSLITGITHSVYHGFNYSPKNAPFPGWIRYGNFMNERNTYWPFFKLINDYKARISALLQHADFFADIAILPPLYDAWAKFGAGNEPFPSLTYPTNLSLIWEAIHQNGNGCDYISDNIINQATVENGFLHYGPRKYHTLFLVQVESLQPVTANKLLQFVQSGGRVVCVQNVPDRSVGKSNAIEQTGLVRKIMEELKTFSDRFIFEKAPQENYPEWYKQVQAKYHIPAYVTIEKGNRFIQQVRYTNETVDMLLIFNSSISNSTAVTINPGADQYQNTFGHYWDAVTGQLYQLENDRKISLTLYPADMRIFVFEKTKRKKAPVYVEVPAVNDQSSIISTPWKAEFRHIDGSVKEAVLPALKDLKDLPDHESFAGTVIYRNSFVKGQAGTNYIDLGEVLGIAQLTINGKKLDARWFGRYLYEVKPFIKAGENSIEIAVTTTMGNYMKSLKDNPVAQYWTNGKRKPQPMRSMGLIGPVTYF